MTSQFEKLEINNILSDEEKKAIDALDYVHTDDLKKALKEEKLSGIDATFDEVAEAFIIYKVEYKEGELICDDSAPLRLKDMIGDKDQNDFAYLIYKISEYLNVETTTIEQEKITKDTKTQLITLKAAIEEQQLNDDVTAESDETEEDTDEDANEKKEENLDITLAEINIDDVRNGVTKQEIYEAIIELKETNSTLANKIIPLLKSGDIIELQLALGMETGANIPLYKKADGMFGRMTLNNLKIGKVEDSKGGVTKAPAEGSETINKNLLPSFVEITFAIENISDQNLKVSFGDFYKNNQIKELQQAIYNSTLGKYPKNSGGPNNRDGILGNGTLDGIKSLNHSNNITSPVTPGENIELLNDFDLYDPLNNEIIEAGKLAVMKINGGRNVKAYAYDNSTKEILYYTPDGVSTGKGSYAYNRETKQSKLIKTGIIDFAGLMREVKMNEASRGSGFALIRKLNKKTILSILKDTDGFNAWTGLSDGKIDFYNRLTKNTNGKRFVARLKTTNMPNPTLNEWYIQDQLLKYNKNSIPAVEQSIESFFTDGYVINNLTIPQIKTAIENQTNKKGTYPIKKEGTKFFFGRRDTQHEGVYSIITYDFSIPGVPKIVEKRTQYLEFSTFTNLKIDDEDMRDIRNEDYTTFQKLRDEYTKIYKLDQTSGTNRKAYQMQGQVHQTIWPGLEDKVGNSDACKVVERATHSKTNATPFLTRGKEQKALGNTHTTLFNYLLYRQAK